MIKIVKLNIIKKYGKLERGKFRGLNLNSAHFIWSDQQLSSTSHFNNFQYKFYEQYNCTIIFKCSTLVNIHIRYINTYIYIFKLFTYILVWHLYFAVFTIKNSCCLNCIQSISNNLLHNKRFWLICNCCVLERACSSSTFICFLLL